MRLPSRFFLSLGLTLSCAACSPVLASGQTKVAATTIEISASQIPTLSALTPPAEPVTTPLSADLIGTAKPTFDLARYTPPKDEPALSCPSGTKEVRTTLPRGWEVHCALGGVKQGPSRSLDRVAMRDERGTYEAGKLHGLSVEVRLTPMLHPVSNAKAEDALAAESANKALTAGWPWVDPSDPACPSGTNLVKAAESRMCTLVDGTAHGPQWHTSSGFAHFRTVKAGAVWGMATLDDGRTAREVVYERGQLVRALEHDRNGPIYLEVHKGEDLAMVHFYGHGYRIVQTRKGKLQGPQISWDKEGRRIAFETFEDGTSRGTSARWQDGQLIELKAVAAGTGVIETFTVNSKSRQRCRIEGSQRRMCETIEDEKVQSRQVYENGRVRGVVRISAKGVKVEESRLSENGDVVSRKTWREDGGLALEMSCNEHTCTTTTWDAAGVAKTTTSRTAQAANAAPNPLAGPISAIRDFLNGAPAKLPSKVAVP